MRKKRVEVGDQDLGLREPFQQVRRQDVALAIVVFRIGRQQHAEAIANGDARRHNQERVGETRVLPTRALDNRLLN